MSVRFNTKTSLVMRNGLALNARYQFTVLASQRLLKNWISNALDQRIQNQSMLSPSSGNDDMKTSVYTKDMKYLLLFVVVS